MNGKETMRFWRRAAGCVTALGVLAGLGACGAPARQAVVTSDTLAQSTAVQDVVEQMDTNGKNYAYVWDAQDVENSTQRMRASMERNRDRALAQDPNAVVRTDEEIEDLLLKYQDMWKRQREKEYAVSPQEAANIAGTVMEELYGLDVSQEVLEIICAHREGSPQGTDQEEIWCIQKPWPIKSESYLAVFVSTETGEVVDVLYGASEEERSAMGETALPACMRLWKDGVIPRYLFDSEDASYPALADKLKRQVTELLSGSWLTGGAKVTHVKLDLKEEPPQDADADCAVVEVYCDNGRTLAVFWQYPFPNYGFSGYPLRAFRIEDRTAS